MRLFYLDDLMVAAAAFFVLMIAVGVSRMMKAAYRRSL
jgi:hypothetical protein